MRKLCYIIAILALQCSPKNELQVDFERQKSSTKSLLQAISIVDHQTIWASGHDGSFVKSVDGGSTWKLFTHPTGDSLQFRDIHAFDSRRAILMSAGPGPLSRIFTFSNDSIWEENFVMTDSLGFLDCIDFWDSNRGIAYGDAIDEYPYILLTSDGGKSWQRAPTDSMPKAGEGEGGFAASGTCVTTSKDGKAWIATGAGGNCRVLLTDDFGISWKEVASPIISGDAAGNTSISLHGQTGFITGGDLTKQDEYTNNCAFTKDGGLSWNLSSSPKTKGAFYGGAITQVENQYFTLACGPNGLDLSTDLGQSWSTLDTLDYWAVSFYENIGFVSGRDGQILKVTIQ